MHKKGVKTKTTEGIPIRKRFIADHARASQMEGYSEILLVLAAIAGISGVAYADSLVVTISLGYLYVLPLSLSALTRYRITTFSLVGGCVVLHDWLGPYEHTGWQMLHRSVLTLIGFTVVVLFVGKLADQRRRLMQVVSAQRSEMALDLAQAVEAQQRLLPQGSPDIPGIEIAGLMSPSKELGGDYYDYIELPQGNIGLVIADVSGKGTPAALFMSSVEVAFRMDTHSPSPTNEIITNLNRVLYELTEQSRYVTLFYTKLDVLRRTLEYTNAGHFPPVILRAGEPEIWLTEGGPVVGLLPEVSYQTASISLNPGDVLILYSDGVIDAENDKEEMYSVERLVSVARANRAKTAQELVEIIRSSVFAFAGTEELRDDLTLVVLKVL
jgi:serine phosphatase RsbU (regulator of sigma subunit)